MDQKKPCNPCPDVPNWQPVCPPRPPMPDECATPGFCPPPAPDFKVPCVPSVLEGQSLYQAMNVLTDRVNTCICTYNQVMDRCYATLRNLESQAEKNGIFYEDGVWSEEGYDGDSGAKYTVTHKLSHDAHCKPIRMQLVVPYNNTTNSGLVQPILATSRIESADRIFTATTSASNLTTASPDKAETAAMGQWYGHVFLNGVPVPTLETDFTKTLYTVAFTKSGYMKFYANTVNRDVLVRDCVDNSIGILGVTAQSGIITPDSSPLVAALDKTPNDRILMGQNYENKEVMILTTGTEPGMTWQQATKILLGYGCDLVVHVASSADLPISNESVTPLTDGTDLRPTTVSNYSCGMLAHGLFVYEPKNSYQPQNVAYWVISKQCQFQNEYQKELADLFQTNAANAWRLHQHYLALKNVNARLDQEIKDRIEADNTEATARVEADNALRELINTEATARIAADDALRELINTEATARIAADDALRELINNEATARIAADDALRELINNEATARVEGDQALQEKLDAEATARMNQDRQLQLNIDALTQRVTIAEQDINQLDQLYASLQEQVSGMDATITSIQLTINNIETALDNLKQSIESIRDGSLNLPYLKLDGTNPMEANLNMGNFLIKNLGTPVEDADAATKAYVDAAAAGGAVGQFLEVAGGTMSGEIDMDNHSITNLPEPAADGDAVNKKYVDDAVAGATPGGDYLPLSGGTMTGNINMDSHSVTNLLDPTASQDAATKKYVDDAVAGAAPAGDYLPLSGGTMTGDIAFSPNEGLTNGENSSFYFDSTGAAVVRSMDKLSLTNGNTSGPITIDGVANPTTDNQAANKAYVDSAVAGGGSGGPYLPLAGGTMAANAEISTSSGNQSIKFAANQITIGDAESGGSVKIMDAMSFTANGPVLLIGTEFNANSKKITSLAAPTNTTDAATKQYVDNAVSGGPYLPLAGGTLTGAITVPAIYNSSNILHVGGSNAALEFNESGQYISVAGKIETNGTIQAAQATADNQLVTLAQVKALIQEGSGVKYNSGDFTTVYKTISINAKTTTVGSGIFKMCQVFYLEPGLYLFNSNLNAEVDLYGVSDETFADKAKPDSITGAVDTGIITPDYLLGAINPGDNYFEAHVPLSVVIGYDKASSSAPDLTAGNITIKY